MNTLRLLLLLCALSGVAVAQEGSPTPTQPKQRLLSPDKTPGEALPKADLEPRGTLPERNSLFPCVISPDGQAVLYVRWINVAGKRARVHALWEGGDVEVLPIPTKARPELFPRPAFSASGKRFLVANRGPDKRISAHLCERGGAPRKLARTLAHVSGLGFIGEDPLVLEVNRWGRPVGYELRRLGAKAPQVVSSDANYSADRLRISPDGQRVLLRLMDAKERVRLRVLDLATGKHRDTPPAEVLLSSKVVEWGHNGQSVFLGPGPRGVWQWSLKAKEPRQLLAGGSFNAVLGRDLIATTGQHALIRRISADQRFDCDHIIRAARGKTLVFSDLRAGVTYVGEWRLPEGSGGGRR